MYVFYDKEAILKKFHENLSSMTSSVSMPDVSTSVISYTSVAEEDTNSSIGMTFVTIIIVM